MTRWFDTKIIEMWMMKHVGSTQSRTTFRVIVLIGVTYTSTTGTIRSGGDSTGTSRYRYHPFWSIVLWIVASVSYDGGWFGWRQ
jgi:hypothetical protein